MLQGGESCEVTVRFTPCAPVGYEARAALLVLAAEQLPRAIRRSTAGAGVRAGRLRGGAPASLCDEDDGSDVGDGAAAAAAARKLVFQIAGEGTPGALVVEPADGVRFGPVRVGYREQRTLTLINQSDGLLSYQIDMDDLDGPKPPPGDRPPSSRSGGSGGGKSAEGPGGEYEGGGSCCGAAVMWEGGGVPGLTAATAAADKVAPPIAFEEVAGGGSGAEWWVDPPEGLIGGRCQKTVVISLLPRRRRRYRVQLLVKNLSCPGAAAAAGSGGRAATGAASALPAPLAAVEVTAEASFPMLLVTDCVWDGVAKQVGCDLKM
jgi:hypothetical protein